MTYQVTATSNSRIGAVEQQIKQSVWCLYDEVEIAAGECSWIWHLSTEFEARRLLKLLNQIAGVAVDYADLSLAQAA